MPPFPTPPQPVPGPIQNPRPPQIPLGEKAPPLPSYTLCLNPPMRQKEKLHLLKPKITILFYKRAG